MLENKKVKDLIKELQELDPEAEVWLSAVNDLGIPSYCVIDYIQHFKFGEVRSDIFGNPGQIDDRLLDNKNDETPIVYIGSLEDFMPLKRDTETDNKKGTPENDD